ncbi:MAG: hypothetical protein Q8R25_00865 [bacterium]|nr:hypothetical protein [bacterium]
MGFEKFVKDTLDARNLRLKNPAIQAKLDAERRKTQEAWSEMGTQTLNTLSRIVWNSSGRLLSSEKVGKGKKSKNVFDPAGQAQKGAVDSTVAVGQLVGKILKASGRTAWYGIRRGIAK